MSKAADSKEIKKEPINRENHPIYCNEEIKQIVEYYKRKFFSKDQNIVINLEEKINGTLDAMVRLYNAATESVDSRRLFKIIRDQHFKEKEGFLEKEGRDKMSLSGLKLLYIDAYESVINKESNKQTYGSKFANCLDSISLRAIWCIEETVEKQLKPQKSVSWNSNLTQIREIPKIDYQNANPDRSNTDSSSASPDSSPASPKTQSLYEEKESSATK